MTAPKMPQDHKKPAVQIEAEGAATVEIQWRGHTFTVAPDPEDWTVETMLAFEEGKVASGVRGVLGLRQWAEVMAEKPRNRDLGELSDIIGVAFGFAKPGE